MTELQQYAELAAEAVDPSSPANLIEQMEKVSEAVARVGEMAVSAEHVYLLAVKAAREHLDDGISEARLAKLVEMHTIEQLIRFRAAQQVLKSLNLRFKALQSALSYLKAERGR